MQRDFDQGYLKIDFAAEPFDSVPRLLARSAAVYFGNLPRLAAVTLVVFVPTKFLLQWLLAAIEVAEGGVLAYALSAVSDLVLGSLVAPTLVYLLVGKLRTGRPAPIRESLRWGERMWGKALWNEFKMQVTVALWGLLLIVPGVVAAVRLAFTDVVVAVEGDETRDVLNRSRELAKGHGWKIFFVLTALGLVDLLIWGVVLRLRLGMAVTDCVLAVTSQWTLTAALLMYLGVRGDEQGR
jgi:uncharacterized membrane protein